MVALSSFEKPPMGRPRKKNTHLPPCVYHRHGAYWLVKGGKWERLGSDLPASLATYGRRFDSAPTEGMGKLIRDALVVILAKQRKGKPLAKETQKQYRSSGKILEEAFADFEPEQVRGKDILRLKRGMVDRQVMFNTALSVLKQVFEYAMNEELVDDNPAAAIKGYERAGRDRLLSPVEFTLIYAEAGPELQCMMDLWRLTGQRVMDVVRIGARQLIDEGIEFKQKKTGAKLIVAWTPELKETVDRAKGLNGNVRSLTLFRGPPTYHQVNDDWRAAVEKSGVENAQARDLRAVAGTEAEEQGLNPQKLLGHTSEGTTRKYLRGRKVRVVSGPSFGQVSKISEKK